MTAPDWLRTPEYYTPRRDRDAFVTKSIRSIASVLATLHHRGGLPTRRFKGSTTVKMLAVFATILLLSLSHSLAFISIAGAIFLLLLSIHPAEEIAAVLKRTLPVLLFTTAVMLPAAFTGHTVTAIMIICKVALSVGAIALLSIATEWRRFSASLAALRVPGIFILVLDITVRYIGLLGEMSLRLLQALALRSVGHNKDKRGVLGGIAGTLFLKSQALAGDLYAAMECRGFTGDYRIRRSFKPSAADAVPVAVVALLVAAFVLTRS